MLVSILDSYEQSEGRIFFFGCSAGIGVPATDRCRGIQEQQEFTAEDAEDAEDCTSNGT